MTDTEAQVEPCPPVTALDGAVFCKRCDYRNAAGLDRCERCKSVLKGNKLAVTHGLRADLPAGHHLRVDVAAFQAGCLSDEGDGHDISTRRRSLLAYRAQTHGLIFQLSHAIETKGLLDRRGRLRATWLQQLQGLIATAKSLDTLLGLERKQRQLPTIEEIMREHEAPK